MKFVSSFRLFVFDPTSISSSWDRRRPRLPASSSALIGLQFRLSMQVNWLFSTGAGGDACGPRTTMLDYLDTVNPQSKLIIKRDDLSFPV